MRHERRADVSPAREQRTDAFAHGAAPPMSCILSASESFATTAPSAALWTALASPHRWPEVLTDLREGRIEPPGRLAEGAVIRTFAKPGARAIDMTYRVTAAEPERHLTFECEGKDWRGATAYLIEGEASARVTLTVSIEPLGFWPRLAVRLWRSVYQDQVGTNLRTRTQAMLQLAETIAREGVLT